MTRVTKSSMGGRFSLVLVLFVCLRISSLFARCTWPIRKRAVGGCEMERANQRAASLEGTIESIQIEDDFLPVSGVSSLSKVLPLS